MEEYLKEELVKELRNVAKKMRDEPNPIKKIYYYSAAYGIVDRTMRYNFSKDLLLTFAILNLTYNGFIERVKAISGGDQVVPLTKEQLDKVTDRIDDLAMAFKNNEDVTSILMDLNLLAYMSSGPGHYMQMNGAFDDII